MDQLEKLMRRGAAELSLAGALGLVRVGTDVLEEDQGGDDLHLALAGAAIVLIHVQDRLEEGLQVLLVETGLSG